MFIEKVVEEIKNTNWLIPSRVGMKLEKSYDCLADNILFLIEKEAEEYKRRNFIAPKTMRSDIVDGFILYLEGGK